MMNPTATIRQAISDRGPACGSTTIIAIDGRSGAGKTEFAIGLSHELGCELISLESAYPGWDGLDAGISAMAEALEVLATGAPASLAQWDWHRSEPAAPIMLEPTELLIIEGVGAGASRLRPFLSFLAWLDAPVEVRRERATLRDGDDSWWATWAAQEEKYLAANRPQDHADLFLPTGPARA